MTPTDGFVETGFAGDVTYDLTTDLPEGLTLDADTGVISGTPTGLAGPHSTLVRARGADGGIVRVGITFDVAATLAPPTQVLSAVRGTPVEPTEVLASAGFRSAPTYSVSPELPAGLTLDPTTGVISGTATGDARATTTYTVTATSRWAWEEGETPTETTTATATVDIDVAATMTPALQIVEGSVGVEIDPTRTFVVGGIAGTLAYSLSPSTLPAGLSFDEKTGVISGTPTERADRVEYTVTATGTALPPARGLAPSPSAVVRLSVVPSVSPSAQSVVGSAGVSIEATKPLTTAGFDAAPVYRVTPELPAGLSLDATTGVVSGTPTDPRAPVVYTVSATEGAHTVAATVTIRVAGVAPASQSVAATWGEIIEPTAALTPTGFRSTVSYSVDPALPQGLALDASTGVVSGTPSGLAQYTIDYTVTAADLFGGTATSVVRISIDPVITPEEITVQGSVGTALTPSTAPAVGGLAWPVAFVTGSLPEGLLLDAATGVISGTPEVAIDRTRFKLSAVAGGRSVSTSVWLQVAGVAPATQTVTAQHGSEFDAAQTFVPTGFSGAVTYTVSPALPEGLSFDTGTGAISGTVSGDAAPAASYTITATGAEAGVATAVVELTVAAVAPAAPATISVAPGAEQAWISWPATTDDGGSSAVTYAVTADPSGLSCTTTDTTCVIVGVTPGATTFSVVASTAAGRSAATTSEPVQITAPIPPTTVPEATAGASIVFRDENGATIENVAPGQRVTVEASGFLPGSAVDAYVFSTPQHVGRGLVDADGSSSFAVTVPAALTPGNHTLVGIGLGTDGTVARGVTAFTVSAVAVAPGTPGLPATAAPAANLPATGGSDPLPVLGLAGLLLAAGAAFAIGTARRRRDA